MPQSLWSDNDVLGQGAFRYSADRSWGRLDPRIAPVRDGHGISEDGDGNIVFLTNEPRNNLIRYTATGELIEVRETRFPQAHGLAMVVSAGEEWTWITDYQRKVVSRLTRDGAEEVIITAESVSRALAPGERYAPTNVALAPDGSVFVSDGYGSNYVHAFDPDGVLMFSLGGAEKRGAHLKQPHAVFIDQRSGAPRLLVCDRGHDELKWFTLAGELIEHVRLPGGMPSNIAAFSGARAGHLAIACLSGMIVILAPDNSVCSVLGGDAPVMHDGVLQPLVARNYVFSHPHDIHVDKDGAIYVAQWWSNGVYPIKLAPL